MISTEPYETKRRFLVQDNTTSGLPKAHLWYSTKEVIKALRLFLEAGDDLNGSLTYRYGVVTRNRVSGHRFSWGLLAGTTWLI